MRSFIMLFATVIVACFAYLLIAAPTAHAADIEWKDGSLVYAGQTYTGPQTATGSDGSGLTKGTTLYQSLVTSGGATTPDKAFVIYFSPGVDPPTADTARYAEFAYHNGTYSRPTGMRPLSITPAPSAGGGGSGAATAGTTSCKIEFGIGWIVCPISNFLANGMDLVYGYIDGFLEVRPLATTQNQPMYRVWSVVRDLANICFVIGFLVMVYGQLSGGLLSNYTIKKVLPRIIVAALLVNLSYWICTIAVDVFNILGYSVKDLFDGVRDSLVGPEGNSWKPISWESVTSFVLSGGSLATGTGIAAYLGITTAATIAPVTGVSGLMILILPMLLSGLFIVLMTFLILAARQALITVLIILAPLAFVAYLLPNTEQWFERWRKALVTLLVLFPAFSMVYGGSQLAASLIIQNADSLNIIVLALGVQVAPLAITPLLLRLGGGLLNRFAGIVNNPTKGVFDRGKTWARERSEQNMMAGRDALARRAKTLGFENGRPKRSTRSSRFGRFRENTANHLNPMNAAYHRDYDKREREGQTAGYEKRAAGLFTQTAAGTRIDHLNKAAHGEQHAGDSANSRSYYQPLTDTSHADYHSRQNAYRRSLHQTSHSDEAIGKMAEEALTNHADEHTQEEIMNSSNLSKIRRDSINNRGRADLYKGKVDALGQEDFRRDVKASTALERIVKDTHYATQQAAQFETIVQKAAEKSWNNHILKDSATKEIHLESVRHSEEADLAEREVTSFVENIKAKGADAPNLTVNTEQLANSIKATRRAIDIEAQEQSSAKIVQQRDLANALKTDVNLRTKAAGVDDQGGINRVLASAKKAVSDELIKATNNFQDTLDYDIASNPVALGRGFEGAIDPTEKIVYARLMARNAPGLKQLKSVLRDYTASRPPEDGEVMLLKEVLSGDPTFRDAGRDLEVWANNERKPNGSLYDSFEDVQDTIGVINNISAERFSRMNAYSQLDALYRLQEHDPAALRNLITRINASPMARNALKPAVTDAIDSSFNGQRVADPDSYNLDNEG